MGYMTSVALVVLSIWYCSLLYRFSTSFDMVSNGCDHNGLVKLVEDMVW